MFSKENKGQIKGRKKIVRKKKKNTHEFVEKNTTERPSLDNGKIIPYGTVPYGTGTV